MLRIRVASLSLIFLLLILAPACNLVLRYEFNQARKLESQGKNEQALDHYFKVLAGIPAENHKWRSEVLFRMGESLWAAGHPNESVAMFQNSANADDENLAAHLRLGTIYLAGGAAERALKQARKVLELASANTDGLALLGAASSATGDTTAAIQAFERVLEVDPKRVAVALALAEIYNQKDEVERAREVLRKAAEAQPTSSLPWLALGRLEEQEGKPVSAEQAYRSAVSAEDSVESNIRLARFLTRTSRPEEASNVLSHADLLNRELPVAHADFKLLAGDPVLAADRYSEILRTAPDEKRSTEIFRARQAGNVRLRDENRARLAARIVEADLEIAAKAAEQDPAMLPATGAARLHLSAYRKDLDQGTVNLLEAETALAESDPNRAAAYADGAVTVAPDSAPAHYVRGVALHRTGDPASARAEWLRAVDLDGNYAPARLALAQSAMDSGDYTEAERYVVPVIRDEPEDVRALSVFARVLFMQGRRASSELIASRAIAINDRAAEPHIILGKIANAQGKLAAALGEYERALTLNPRSEEAMRGLMRLYARGHIDRAMLLRLEQVAETPPASAPLLEISGRIYAMNGYRKDAERCFRRALSIDPYRVTAASMLADIAATQGDYVDAFKFGARKGGADGALMRALSAENRHDANTAVREYEMAVRQGEPSGIAANNLAWILAQRTQNLDHALSMAEKARSLAPDSPDVLDTLGFVYLQRREFSSAIPVLRQAQQLAIRKRLKGVQVAIGAHLEQAVHEAGENTEMR